MAISILDSVHMFSDLFSGSFSHLIAIAVETISENPEVAEAAEKGGLFDIDATLPIMAIQFLLLVVILNAIFFKPLTKAIDERNDYVRTNLNTAKDRLRKAEQLAKQYESELVSTRRATQELIATAQAEASKLRNQQVTAALTESQELVTKAKAEVEQQKLAATASLEAEVESLSQQILAKLLGNLVHS
ncbi:MAG: F0F1 ATP synthase subunit B' [Pseudanabaenaceae cyanobacterium bins.68]|nr:F0F1 ATP synthase subunit B' [Pseudanabaenaceae cyanobacterium bins.68]